MEVNKSRSAENRCFKWFTGPHRKEKLMTENKLPSVKSKANFRALNTRRGKYIAAKEKQTRPMVTHARKPNILCLRPRLGKQGSDSALENHEVEELEDVDPVSSS